METEKILELLAHRSSCRTFTDRAVSPQLIDSLLETAIHAPTTGNMQLYSAIVTTSAEGLKALAALHYNQPASVNCRAMVTFCADTRRLEQWCRVSDADFGFANRHGFLTAVLDTAIVAQQFVTAAELAGLGTCYLGTATYNAPEISKLLALPHGVVPLLAVALGYPAQQSATPTERLPLEAVRHHEKYSTFSNDDIRRMYSAKEELPENRKFVTENHKDNLAQVYAEVRYPRAVNEQLSEKFFSLTPR